MGTINTYLVALSIAIGSVVLSIIGLMLIRKKMEAQTLTSCHEVGGFLFAAVSTLYAVLLGLLVVDSLSKFQDAQHQTEQEANSVANIYMLAEELPQVKRQQIQDLCTKYCHDVVDLEWPEMNDSKYSADARMDALRLVRAVNGIKVTNESESSIAQTAMSQGCDFWSTRRSRIVTATHNVPPIEWMVLIIGGIITITFTYFFGLENLRVQMAMTGMVALMTSLNLFLFYMFSQPHSGSLRINADSFIGDLLIFAGREHVLPEATSSRSQAKPRT